MEPGTVKSVVRKVPHVTHLRWQLFLIVFAIYLSVHFYDLLLVAPELFSNAGVLPIAKDLPTYPFFPNILFFVDPPLVSYGLIGLLLIASVLLPKRRFTTWAALLLWFGWACLVTRNPFIRNPGMPYVGWIFLAIALVSWWNKDETDRAWSLPAPIFWWAWFFLGFGYTLSGIHKMGSPSWQDGLALSFLLENPLSRPGFVSGLLHQMPEWAMKAQTWFALALETLAFPLFLRHQTRIIGWLALTGMHIAIMLTVDFVDLTLGMIMIHFFVFDERWLQRKGEAGIVFFDGICNMCNTYINTIIPVIDAGTLQVASLQGKTAKKQFAGMELPDTIIYFRSGEFLTRSDAIIAIGRRCGGLLRLIAEVLALAPKGFRDSIYDKIAKSRYRLFGQKFTCRLPTPDEKSFFLP